jgi:hypothetical protein
MRTVPSRTRPIDHETSAATVVGVVEIGRMRADAATFTAEELMASGRIYLREADGLVPRSDASQ